MPVGLAWEGGLWSFLSASGVEKSLVGAACKLGERVRVGCDGLLSGLESFRFLSSVVAVGFWSLRANSIKALGCLACGELSCLGCRSGVLDGSCDWVALDESGFWESDWRRGNGGVK